MSGLSKLIGNENKKTAKQLGFSVLLIIIAVISAASVALGAFISANTAGRRLQETEYIVSMAERARESGDMIGEKYWRVYEHANDLFENRIGGSDAEWKIELFYNDYSTILGWIAIAECAASGRYTIEDIQKSALGSFLYHDMPEEIAKYDGYLSEENIAKALPALRAYEEKLRNEILNYSLADHYAVSLDTARAERDLCAAEAELYASGGGTVPEWATSPEVVTTYREYMRASAESRLETAELSLYGWQLLCENLYEYGSWQYRTVSELLSALAADCTAIVPIPRELYEAQYRSVSYERYLRGLAEAQRRFDDTVTLVKYSLDRNIPLEGAVKGSAKKAVVSAVSTATGLLAIFSVILAGTTLSGEYTSGTIRLLLIRPRGRGKILASKLISLYIRWFASALILSLMLTAECAVIYGINDIFTPDLFIVGGHVVPLPSVLTLILRIILAVLSASPTVLLALMISTLIKRPALPIALSMIARLSTATVTSLAVLINTTLPGLHLEYSPLPYLDLTVFITTPAAYYMTAGGGLAESIIRTATFVYSSIYSLTVGIVWMALLSVLLTALSFVSFTKQQIKN